MIPTFHLDAIIFYTFLASNLLIGLWAGRQVKTIRAYAIGNKDFSTTSLTSTIIATQIGGGFLFYALKGVYTTGLAFIIVLLGARLGLLFVGQVMAVRMGEFLHNVSIAEAMGDLYGRTVRVIVACSSLIKGAGGLAIQFQVMSRMLSLILGIEGVGVIMGAATILVFYSAFGGIRSVTVTDVFQFFAFSIFIPMLALIVWKNLETPNQIIHILTTNPIFNFWEVVDWSPSFIGSVGLMLYFAIPGPSPARFQRIVMARDMSQARDAFTYAAGITLIMVMGIAWIGILLLASNSELDPKNLVPYLIEHYSYPGFKGFIAVGIVAMAMSTADSYLNAAAVVGVNDIIKVFRPNFKESLTTVRLFSAFLGVLGVLLAIRITNILDILLYANSFYMPIVTAPFLLAIFGFRSSSRAVIIGMLGGISCVLYWQQFMAYTGLNSIIPGLVVNLVFLIGAHYLLRQPGGWVGIKEPGPLVAARQARRERWEKFFQAIKHPRPYAYLQKNLPVQEGIYTLFGIYVIGATYASFFTVPDTIVATYPNFYNCITHSVLIAATGFLTYPIWPPTFKSRRFIAFAWPMGIFYLLFVVGAMLVIMSGFHQVQVMIFMLNIIIAALLLFWPLVLGLSLGGIILAYEALLWQGVHTATDVAISFQFRFIYALLLFSSFLIALIRFKQAKMRIDDQNAYLRASRQDFREQLIENLGYSKEFLRELSQEDVALFDSTAIAYIQQAIYRVTDYLRLQVKQVSLDELVKESKRILRLQDLDVQPQLIIQKNTEYDLLQVDPAKIEQMIVDSIVYIQEHNSTHNPITIALKSTQLGHQIVHIQDYTRRLDALKITITADKQLPVTKDIYMISPMKPNSDESDIDPALLENRRIVDAHYGYVDVSHSTTHIYVIPINVREVRGKVMELLKTPAKVDPEELKHPLAVQLEQELLDRLKDTEVDFKVIRQALDVIKKYHGGVKRKSGEPFFTHSIQAALILLGYSQDQDAVVAALLHDIVEDTSLSMAQVRAKFGGSVASLVEKSTNLEDKIKRISMQDHEYNYHLMHYGDPRAALVKLSDRLHNIRTIKGHSSLAKRRYIANETLLFYVPIAQKCGFAAMEEELQQLSLEVLDRKL